MVLADTSSGNFTLTLPGASSSSGLKLQVKDLNTDGGLTISSSDGIDGLDFVHLAGAGNLMPSVEMICDGNAWYIISASEGLSFGTLAISEPFDFGASSGTLRDLTDQRSSPKGWNSNKWDNDTNSVSYQTTNLSFSGGTYDAFDNTGSTGIGQTSSAGSNYRGLDRQLSTTLSGEVWVSYLVEPQALNGLAHFGFRDSDTGYGGPTCDAVGLSGNTTSIRPFFFDDSSDTYTYASVELTEDITYLVVLKLDIQTSADDSVDLWIFRQNDVFTSTEAGLGSANLQITTADWNDGFNWLRFGGRPASGSSSADAQTQYDAIRFSNSSGDAGVATVLEGQIIP